MEKGWGPGYENSCIHSGFTKTGGDVSTVWYNYALATAGTIIDKNTTQQSPATNTTTATESICPKGWTLPTLTQMMTIVNQSTIFSPVLGGYYYNSKLYVETTRGSWWSSAALNTALRLDLNYNSVKLFVMNLYRVAGDYIRCVQKS